MLTEKVEGSDKNKQAISCLREEREEIHMEITYVQKGKNQCAVGVFMSIQGREVDLRNHVEREIHPSQVPDGYDSLKIPLEQIVEYRILKPSDSKP